jgi:hypothetical protein
MDDLATIDRARRRSGEIGVEQRRLGARDGRGARVIFEGGT